MINRTILGLVFAVASTYATIGPVNSVVVSTNSGVSGEEYVIEQITVDGYTVEASQLAFGTSSGEVDNLGPGVFNEITDADDYDLNTVFGRSDGGINPLWVIRSFGDAVFTSVNGGDPDFFIFEAGGDDALQVRAILDDGSEGVWVTISTGPGNNWGDTGVVKTTSNNDINDGQNIYGIAFDITDLGVGEDAVLQGIDLTSATIDGASVLAAVPEPSALSLILLGAAGFFSRPRRG